MHPRVREAEGIGGQGIEFMLLGVGGWVGWGGVVGGDPLNGTARAGVPGGLFNTFKSAGTYRPDSIKRS